MQVIVKKWGNSASVRIPAAIMVAAHLSLDDIVDVREEDGRIIIEPVRSNTYTLAQLLDGITPEIGMNWLILGKQRAKRLSNDASAELSKYVQRF